MSTRDPLRTKLDAVARDCLGMRARMLDRAVTNLYNAGLEEFGVKLSQMNVLIAVGKLSPASPADVANALYLEPSTLSRNAERLRKSGYLDVVPGTDARSRCYVLSDQGRELIDAAYPRWRQLQRAAKKMLGEGATEALVEFSKRRPFEAPEA